MVAAAERGRPIIPILKKLCPYIHRQIVEDGKFPGILSLWGRSVNVDENVGQVIVHPAILRAIGDLAGVPMRGRIVHAGLQHSYGYLFSLIDTPYGAKRDRWVSTDLERGFGIDLSLLGDRPRKGTLLGNLTWFLGQIVHRGGSVAFRGFERRPPVVAPALLDYDYARLAVCRVAELAVLPGRTRRQVSLFTDLVPFPHLPADPSRPSTLLVYSVRYGSQAPIRLVTAFTVTTQVVQEIKASVRPREKVPVRLKYNAYVPGFRGRTVWGRRFFPGTQDQIWMANR